MKRTLNWITRWLFILLRAHEAAVNHLLEAERQWGGAMMSGCFHHKCICTLVAVGNSVDKVAYVEILTKHLLPLAEGLVPNSCVFYKEKETSKTSNNTKQFLAYSNIDAMK